MSMSLSALQPMDLLPSGSSVTGTKLTQDAQLVKDQLDAGNTAGAKADMSQFENDMQSADPATQQQYAALLQAAQNGVNSTGDGTFNKKATDDAMNFADPNGTSGGSELAGTQSPDQGATQGVGSGGLMGELQQLEQQVSQLAQQLGSGSATGGVGGQASGSNASAIESIANNAINALKQMSQSAV